VAPGVSATSSTVLTSATVSASSSAGSSVERTERHLVNGEDAADHALALHQPLQVLRQHARVEHVHIDLLLRISTSTSGSRGIAVDAQGLEAEAFQRLDLQGHHTTTSTRAGGRCGRGAFGISSSRSAGRMR
jgi:hypothetical protein